jgi:hypothetical protein
MTRNAKKCVQEFLDSDGLSIAGKNLKAAADLFAGQQEGCCPKSEVLRMFRTALHEGTMRVNREDDRENGIVVGYRALREYERDEAEERLYNEKLRNIRRQKARTPKPSSHRRNPAPPILIEPNPVFAQDDELVDNSQPTWEPELVSMS